MPTATYDVEATLKIKPPPRAAVGPRTFAQPRPKLASWIIGGVIALGSLARPFHPMEHVSEVGQTLRLEDSARLLLDALP